MTNIILHCSMYANQMGFNLEIGDEVTDEMRGNQTFQSLLFDNHIEIGTPEDLLALSAFKMYKESVRSQPKRVTEKDIFLAAWRICSEKNIPQSNLTPASENSGGVFVPCGEGDNICNCKSSYECGYSKWHNDATKEACAEIAKNYRPNH